MDNRLNQDALIEDALNTVSLAPMPRSVTPDVMARIQKNTRPVLVTWNDLVLSLVFILSFAAAWFAFQNLPPIVVIKLRIQGILLYQDFLVNARWLIPALIFGSASLLAALSIPMLFQMIPGQRK